MFNNLGNIFRQQGKLGQAFEMYSRAKAIYEKVYGFDHPSTAVVYTNIGNLYFTRAQLQDALKMYIQAKCIRERYLGMDNVETLYSLKNIAMVYVQMNSMNLALENLQKCKKMLTEKFEHSIQKLLRLEKYWQMCCGPLDVKNKRNKKCIIIAGINVAKVIVPCLVYDIMESSAST